MKTKLVVPLAVVLGLAALLCKPVARHARAAELLLRLSENGDTIAGVEMRLGTLRARRYAAGEGAPVVLLVHGVHPQGIDEPRLRRFAGLLAEQGITVITPELESLRTCRLDPHVIDELSRSARDLQTRERVAKVGVVGISIGGGLSILAAARERAIGAVLAVGPHHDLVSLARFWASDAGAERYGREVLAYAYASEFFAGVPDADAAREALRARLHGDSAARRAMAELSSVARARIEALHRDGERSRLLAIVHRHRSELAALSPARRLRSLRIPVFLLHGVDDPLVPSAESARIFRGLPARARGGLVQTRLLRHADLEDTTVADELAVVGLVADALEAFER